MDEREIQPDRCLRAYLLGTVDFASVLALQRRLVYEIAGDRSSGALILCEHPPTISVGRLGSRLHIRLSDSELHARRWPVKWVNRGAGCLLHAPGQLAIYPVIAIDELQLSPTSYLAQIHDWIRTVVRMFDVPAETQRSGLWVQDRQIAHVGIAIRQWVSYFGAALNMQPNLEIFRHVACDGAEFPMTSMERELRTPVRISTVRQRLLESFADAFAFDRVAVFHSHPALPLKATTDAVVTPAY